MITATHDGPDRCNVEGLHASVFSFGRDLGPHVVSEMPFANTCMQGFSGLISMVSKFKVLIKPLGNSTLQRAIDSSLSANLHIAHRTRYSHLAASKSAGNFVENSADTPMKAIQSPRMNFLFGQSIAFESC